MTLLTEEEVAELAEGTEVEITWSGGNGPHRYRIHQCRGETFADIIDRPGVRPGSMRHYNPITFVGSERYHTHVSAVEG